MKKLFILLFLILPILLFSEQKIIRGKVTKVTDGDTIKVKEHKTGVIYTIRLYGIDCPELSQPYGKEARKFVEEMILNKNVDVVTTGGKSYDRIVGIVYYKDKILNGLLVSYGFAWIDPRYCKNEQFADAWYKNQKKAMLNNYNLWSQADPMPPWEYRRSR
jgi:endonuclease YncB( thermonuclease family)